MSSFEERILVGIIDPHTYVTKSNNKDCSYVDIAFEQFPDEFGRSGRVRYGIVNQEKFLDEEPKVFLTSNAKNSIAKFGEERLIKLIANTSPEERGCKYTVHNEKMSRVDPYDFVEIVEAKIDSFYSAERVAYLKSRPSTDYVIVKCTKFIVDKEDFPFVSKTEEFFRREDAEKYLRDCFFSTYGEITLDNAGCLMTNNSHAVAELNRKFFSSINRAVCSGLTDEELKNVKPDENRIREAVREQIRNLAEDNGFVAETVTRVSNGIRAKAGVEEALTKLRNSVQDENINNEGEDESSSETPVRQDDVQAVSPVFADNTVREDAQAGVSGAESPERADEISEAPAVSAPVSSDSKKEKGFSSVLSGNANEYIFTESDYRGDAERWKQGFLKEKSSESSSVTGFNVSMSVSGFGTDITCKSGTSTLGAAVNKATKRSYLDDVAGSYGSFGFNFGGTEEEEEEEAVGGSVYGGAEDVPSFSPKLYSLIKTKEVLVGPFVVAKFKQTDDSGDYSCECVLNIPDNRCQLAVRDSMNSCVKAVEYDLLQDYIKTVKVNGTVRQYLVQMPVQIWLNSGKKHDFIDDKKLVDNYAPTLLNTIFKDLNVNQLSRAKQNALGLAMFKNEPERVRRCFTVLQHVVEFDNERNKLFSMLMKNPGFQEFFNTYLEKNIDSILATYRKDLFSDIKKEKDREQKELNRISSEIEQKKQTLAKLSKKTDAAEQAAESRKDAQAATAEIAVKVKGKTVSSEEHEVLKSEHKKLQNEYEALKKQVSELQKTKQNLDAELNHSFADLSSRYLEMHSMLKAFTTPRQVKDSGFNFDSSVPSVVNIDNLNKARKRYIEELLSSMKSFGRSISVEKLVSMVVTIAQNQFTVLAGLPGSGKTSFVKTMGKALNLGNRLHTIPVARGWTSQRDIMGYWNSLTSSFQPAPTGLWELLTTLDDERDWSAVTPSILLLDEMNLSSPEHYFSSFMQLADADGNAERRIFTGSPERSYLTIPSYLRFVGTVNSDDTVNVMSARMLDRSAVILFDEKPSQSDDNRSVKNIPHSMQTTYSAADWKTLFDTEDARIQNRMYAVLNDIEEILYKDDSKLGQRIVVSYRKHQQIINYLSVVDPLLASLKNCDSEGIAMDFAVKQFVLPMINGFGESFGTRLEELLNILDKYNLTESLTVLQRIISEGEDRMNSYQFLA